MHKQTQSDVSLCALTSVVQRHRIADKVNRNKTIESSCLQRGKVSENWMQMENHCLWKCIKCPGERKARLNCFRHMYTHRERTPLHFFTLWMNFVCHSQIYKKKWNNNNGATTNPRTLNKKRRWIQENATS